MVAAVKPQTEVIAEIHVMAICNRSKAHGPNVLVSIDLMWRPERWRRAALGAFWMWWYGEVCWKCAWGIAREAWKKRKVR